MRNGLRSLLALTSLMTLAACGPYQPTAADKAVCLTIADLNDLGLGADVVQEAEHWFGIRSLGTEQLGYDYDQPLRRDGKKQVFVQCQATKQRTSVEAMSSYQMGLITSKAIALGDIDERRRAEGGCEGADACVLIEFLVNDVPIGNHFVVRSGRRVVTSTIIGGHFDSPAEWRGIVAKKVAAMRRLD